MKKFFAALLVLAQLFVASVSLIACAPPEPDPVNSDLYTVVLDFNDGVSRDGMLLVPKTQSVQLPSEPVREGYAFAGWETESGEQVPFSYTPTADVTLVAQWETGSCTVTFDLNYEGSKPITQEVDYGSTIANAPAPERENYAFRFWSVSPNGEAVDFASYPISGDYTFYAVWRDADISEYTVSFNAGAYTGAPAVSEITILQGDTVRESDAPRRLNRPGYELAGWTATAPEGADWTIDSFPAEGVPELIEFPYEPTGSVTLYAVWTIEQYTAVFDSNYTDSTYPNGICYSYELLANENVQPPEDPVRENYEFVGWYTAERGGTQVDFDAGVKLTANGIYYARWKHKGVQTDVFQAEYVEFDPLKEYWGYSGSVKGASCIVKDTGSVGTVTIDQYPTNSVLKEHFGYYVSYQYERGCTLRFEIESSAAVTATLIGSFAIEGTPRQIGPTGENANEIRVNGTALNYAPMTLQTTFAEYTIGSIQLKEGTNVIEIVVANSSTAMGGTYKAVGFMTDYIKIADHGSAQLTWSPIFDNLEVVYK